MKDGPVPPLLAGVRGSPLDVPGIMLYTMHVSITQKLPITGAEAAQLAWTLSRRHLEAVIPPGAPEAVLEEIRAALAAWCTAHPRSVFADLESVWNQFVAPRHGLPAPAVLLPGNACPECRRNRYQREELNRVAYQSCYYCKGTGHLPPRANPTRYAHPATYTQIP